MSFRRRCGVFAVLAVSVVFAAGCGGTKLDDVKTEALIEGYLEDSLQKQVAAVECPSGVDVEKGATLDCDVTLDDGERETATVKILDEDANVEVASLKASK